jgi:hypothetical protein
VSGNILLFFYKKKTKQNKKNDKILQATSACCGAVVRNECRDHFSIIIIICFEFRLIREVTVTNAMWLG